MTNSLTTPAAIAHLDQLYNDAAAKDPAAHAAIQQSGVKYATEKDFFLAMRGAYMPISRQFGHLLYSIARTSNATTIVEFGMSFGLSTIFLAAAIKDGGQGGRVITTEFEPGKVIQARKNLAVLGLDAYVDIREGDAFETLRANPPKNIDLVLLDGAKSMYLGILRQLEPCLRPGAIIASDNTDFDGFEEFLAYVRSADNGYFSSAILTAGRERTMGHEISIHI